jgi:predicted acetyltransferase
MSPSLEYHATPDRADIDAFYPILVQSLYFPKEGAGGWVDMEGPDTFRLVTRHGQLVGGMTVQRMGQWFGDRSVPCGAVRCVAVRPDARAGGVARFLMAESLLELREQGFPLAALYPATQRLYRSVGYETAGSKVDWLFDLHRLEVRERTLDVRAGGPADLPLLRELYQRRARGGQGLLDRSDWMWERVTLNGLEAEPRAIWILEGDDGAEGYALTHNAGGWGAPDKMQVVVRDHVALTQAAGLRLLALLGDHRSIVEKAVISGGPALPLMHLMPQPVWTPPHKSGCWMLRIVDVAAALQARGFGPGRAGRLELDVTDDVLPANQGRWVLEVADGQAEVRPGGSGSLRLDVRGLAALYSGFSTARELSSVGLADGPEAQLDLATSLFAGPAPWMPDHF